jgi:hypothetical protein
MTEHEALRLLHSAVGKQEDALLVLLAVSPDQPVTLAELKDRGKRHGVNGIAQWGISKVLGASKGKAVTDSGKWRITALGLDRVEELRVAAGVPPVSMPQKPAIMPTRSRAEAGGRVFVGHGSSKSWLELSNFLESRLSLSTDEFNRVSAVGKTTVSRLQEMLNDASFAFLILTAEDETADGRVVARQNVVHEAGLFQGRLGFERAIVLLEHGCDEFSNLSGLVQIRFPKDNIGACFEAIRQVLEREKII